MSVTSTIVPATTTTHDAGFDPSAGTIEGCLSDGNDATYVSGQISASTSTRSARGELTDLPAGVGVVRGMVVNLRGYRSTNPGDTCSAWAGDNPLQRVTPTLTGSVAPYASGSITDYTTPAQINALQWYAGIAYVSHDGTQGFITEVSFDVTWDPVISGMKALFLSVGVASLLGGALLLQEMPRLAEVVRERARTVVPPAECVQAYRELREHRWPRYCDLGRRAA